jgi:hypothetical protein
MGEFIRVEVQMDQGMWKGHVTNILRQEVDGSER